MKDNKEYNRLTVNHYNYLTSSLAGKGIIISRIDNQEFKANKLIAFLAEGKDNNLTYFTLSLRPSITKYFTLVKTEKNIILIRK